MATTLYRQESEVASELKLALEEACLELGVSLSSAFLPSAWWLFDATAEEEPSLADLAGWLSITRRRSYRPSPLHKYRKYALASVDDGETASGEQRHDDDENVEVVVSSGDGGSDVEAPLQEMRLKERLSNAVELDVLSEDFDWGNLVSVHRTEHAQSEDDEGSTRDRDSISSVEVTVNSGGVVYFAMFRNSRAESQESDSTNSESAAVFKFGSSRLGTQSERLGIEIARHLGVATPQARVIHSNSSEWGHIQDSLQAIRETAEEEENEIGLQTCEELLEALRLSRCMLVMGYIRGKPLAESKQAFSPEKVAVKTAVALGRTLILDMVLRNEDRLVCHALGWRGNAGNLLVTENVPHGSDKLGPPATLDSHPASGGPGICRQRRTQSFTALSLSTSADADVGRQFAKALRAPSPDLSHLGTAESHALTNLLIQEEPETPAVKKDELEKQEGGGVEASTCMLVAIDSGVSRRPPGMKVEQDRRVYSKTIELLLHDEETAANFLREISFGFLGPPFENEPLREYDPASTREDMIDYQKVTKAFQRGLVAGIRDMQVLRMFLVKLYRTLDHLLRGFMGYVSSQSDMAKSKQVSVSSPSPTASPSSGVGEGSSTSPQGIVRDDDPSLKVGTPTTQTEVANPSPESTPNRVKSPRFLTPRVSPSSSLRRSPGSSPRVNSPNRISPLRENWHGKGSPGRMTIKLKDVSKTAKIDGELSKTLEWWDEKLRSEGQKLCKEHSFTTGFLEGGGSHSLVDSYELKVRLEHILERMTMISNGADTEKPSCVISPYLYIGSALAARSVHTLQHLGVTHVLCLCPSDLEVAHVGDFPDLFTYKNLAVKDVEDEIIAAHFEDACSFIELAQKEGKAILVHCFEGKSRSATVVLAYLMLRKHYSLAQAWSMLKTAHRRTQPNDGFMKTLVELDRKLHGTLSMSFPNRRPVGQRCPICDKLAGLSLVAVHQHIKRVHPGVLLPLSPKPMV